MANLFDQVTEDTPSKINPTRRLSAYAGRVFYASYAVANSTTKDQFRGRLVDLQPAKDPKGRLGVRVVFWLLKNQSDSSTPAGETLPASTENDTDRGLHDEEWGPFDSVSSLSAQLVPEESDDNEHDTGHVNLWGLKGTADDGEVRELKINISYSS